MKRLLRGIAYMSVFAILAACGGGGGQDFTVFGNGGLSGEAGTGAGGTDGVAVVQIGSGVSSAFVLGAATASETSLQAGESTTITVNIVDVSGNPVIEGAVVTFSSTCSASGLAIFSETPVSTTTGQAQTTYTPQGCSGTDTVTAVLQENSTTATVDLTIAPNQVLSVAYSSATKTQIQIGGQDTTELTFVVTGAAGAPVIAEDVSFTISSSLGGAIILPGRESDTTDNNGEVNTILRSGTVAGTINIVATHNATGFQGTSADIVVSTGVPDASFFSFL